MTMLTPSPRLDVRDRARGDVANAPLELQCPSSSPASARPADVEREHDVGARLARALAQDELVEQRALAPVDVARIVAFAHGAEAEVLVAGAAADERRLPPSAAPRLVVGAGAPDRPRDR